MNRKLLNRWLMVACVLLVGNSLWLAGCAQRELAAKQPLPTPTGIATMRPRETSPAAKPGQVVSYLVTPVPGETVRLGDITEATPVPPAHDSTKLRYSVREDIPPWQGQAKPSDPVQVRKLFVRDSQTGQEIRLGDDYGDARLEAVTNEYVIWRQIHYGHEDTALKTGLYAYVLTSGIRIVIAQEPGYPWDSLTEGQWVVYRFPDKGDMYFTRLRAHNLTTGQDFLVGETVPYNRPGDYYTISAQKIAWVEGTAICVYDLATRTVRTLNVPIAGMPVEVSLSGDIVVWWDEYWKGYDMKSNAIFTIPTVPPGWENMPVNNISRVTVKDDRLYWSFDLGGRTYNLTAPIIRDK